VNKRIFGILITSLSLAITGGVAVPAVNTAPTSSPSPQVVNIDASSSGCAPGTTLVVPSASAVSQFGVSALVPAGRTDFQSKLAANPELMKILKNNPRWLSSLSCKTNLPPESDGVCSIGQCQANWAGWQDNYANYNSGFISYNQPTVPASPTANAESTSVWMGMGQGRSQTDQLVQDGTVALAGPGFAGIGNYAGVVPFYELFPDQDEEVVSNFPLIHTGDTVTAQALWSGADAGGTASFIICDANSNTCAYPQETPLAPAAFTGQTEEWIVERSTLNGDLTKLAPFSTVSVGGASGSKLSSGGDASFTLNNNEPAGPWDMNNCANTQMLATTSQSIITPGDFTVTFDHSGSVESC
jgi:hypothetical protein